MITKYPQFTPLNKDNLGCLQDIVNKYDPYSDFSVVSLYCWAGENEVGLSMLNDNLIVSMQDYITRERITTVLGVNRIDDTLAVLLKDSASLVLLPEIVIDAIEDKNKYRIVEDPDNHDYVYQVSRLAALEGGRYKKKRNKLAKLKQVHGHAIASETLPLAEHDKKVVLGLFDAWAKSVDRPKSQTKIEREALKRVWDMEQANILVTYVRYKGRVVGFSINELLDTGYAICHFEKALKPVENIYTYLVHEVANVLKAAGVQMVNWEQDLGVAGLRASKTSYGPELLLKKYSLSLAEI